ncbi:MAG: type I-B CRISPR-associated protein Cas7/Csh2 [Candidatus Aenigmatarchaeota archaeon]
MSEIKNRSEIVFLYDVNDANPNGDPLDEDKPRIDQQTETNIVTDVRLKRTIRDYLSNFKDQNIFIQSEKVVEEGEELIKSRGRKLEEELVELLAEEELEVEEKRQLEEKIHKVLGKSSANDRRKMFLGCLTADRDKEEQKEIYERFEELRTTVIKEKVFDRFIDLRLFGSTLAVQNIQVKQTGPVQFKFGRSLHKVDYDFYKGSITMPVEPGQGREKGKKQAEFSQEYRLPYSLISFYGIVNENAAEYTGLTEKDIDLIIDGIWNGTKNLITRSKIGQVPRLLMRIVYDEDNYHIGDLDKKIKMRNDDGKPLTDEEQKKIRSVEDYILNVDSLKKALQENKENIDRIELNFDSNLTFDIPDGKQLDEYLEEIGIEVKNLGL